MSNFLSTYVKGPAKAAIRGALRPCRYDIRPIMNLSDHAWFGLPERPIRTVLDIGACDGGFAETILMPRFPGARIHSFEPTPDAFTLLKPRAEASRGRILPHNVALGDTAGRMSFNLAFDAIYSSSLLRSTELCNRSFPPTSRTRKIEVEIRPLDDVAQDLGIEDELLVKIDVQGFEDRVIRGGLVTLGRAVACIVEIQSAALYEGQPNFHQVYTLLSEIGFSFEGCLDQVFAPDGSPLFFDAVFLRHSLR